MQLEKIDKQLNKKGDVPRASINFIATFTSFKSNRVHTFKYSPDVEIKPLDYDTTIAIIKNVVKEAMSDLIPRKEADKAATSSTDITSTETSSKNLCAINSCSFGQQLTNPVWIQCNYGKGEEKSCNYWVHASCIGFPSLKHEDVKLLDHWCCPDHVEIQMQ